MQLYSFSPEDLTANANNIKEVLLEKLERDGLLNKPANDIGKHYVVVLHKPRWFGKWFAATCSKPEKDDLRITIAKVD